MSNGLALYELAAEYRAAALQLADMELDEQTLADTLEGLSGSLENKAVNVAMFVRNLEALAESIKAAEHQQNERRRIIEARAARIRAYLKGCLEYAQIHEIQSPHLRLAIKRNPPSVVIEDAAALPADYWTQPEPPPPLPDKKRIADALKQGEAVPGARLDDTKTRLEIR